MPSELAILTSVAFATSAFTATVGLGGGVILLIVMLFYLEPLIAIPVHGLIQLVSNGSRTYIQREHVRWEVLSRYGVLLLPSGYLAIVFVQSQSPESLKMAIGLFVLLATWLPSLPWARGAFTLPPRGFLVLGGVVGALNVTVGATGPIVGPFFRGLGLSPQGTVGTFAACQATGHLAKLVVFGTFGFAFVSYLAPVLVMAAAVVVGTWLGSKLLERVHPPLFQLLYRGVLTLVALRLVVWDGLEALGWRG